MLLTQLFGGPPKTAAKAEAFEPRECWASTCELRLRSLSGVSRLRAGAAALRAFWTGGRAVCGRPGPLVPRRSPEPLPFGIGSGKDTNNIILRARKHGGVALLARPQGYWACDVSSE